MQENRRKENADGDGIRAERKVYGVIRGNGVAA
jgi:hypothetical protein